MAEVTETFDAIAAGTALGEPRHLLDHGYYAVIPEGYKLEDLERFLGAPIRARAAVTAKSADTFAAYVKQFQDGAATVIFADQEKTTLVGIIDYHEPLEPAFREHRVTYAAPLSLEWKTWKGANAKPMEQAQFAQFIEDNVVDIHQPVGAEVLEVSRSLQAKSKVEFSSALRLANGDQQFSYSETIDGSTSKGAVKVPEEFTLGIPVFFGGFRYEIRARLRYRIKEGKLSLWYDLYRPEYVEKDAFESVCGAVGLETGIAIWQGAP